MRVLLAAVISLLLLSTVFIYCSNNNAAQNKFLGVSALLSVKGINVLERAPKTGEIVGTPSVHIYAAKNEVEPFQFVISAAEDVAVSAIHLDALLGPNNSELSTISLFREHYVDVSKPSQFSPYPPQSYPDALIPLNNRPPKATAGNEKYPALPILLKANENQPIWVDIAVPENQLAGDYKGTVIVNTSNGEEIHLPITLTVWNFTLPKRSPLRTLAGMDAGRIMEIYKRNDDKERTADDWQLIRKYYDLLLDHRFSPGEFADASPYPDEESHQLLDTEEIPGLGTISENMLHYINEKNASTYMYAFGQRFKDNPNKDGEPFNDMLHKNREKSKYFLAAYADWCHQFLSDERCQINYAAFHDEPESASEYEVLRQWGQLINEASELSQKKIHMVVSESPVPNAKTDDDPDQNTPIGSLVGFSDGWNMPTSDLWMLSKNTDNTLAKRLHLQEPIYAHALAPAYSPRNISDHYKDSKLDGIFIGRWLEGSLCSTHYPNQSKCTIKAGVPGGIRGLDYPAINYRITAWLIEPYGITGLEEWDTLYWTKDDTGNDVDVWESAGNIINSEDEEPVNADGMLVYPGTIHTVNFDGPVASMRLKWLRESVDDFSYIKLLRERGEDTFIKQQTSLFIRDLGNWDDAPEKMLLARKAFGEKLSTLQP